jgi:hypothetical protein
MKYYIICLDYEKVTNVLSYDEESARDLQFLNIKNRLEVIGFTTIDDRDVTDIQKCDVLV